MMGVGCVMGEWMVGQLSEDDGWDRWCCVKEAICMCVCVCVVCVLCVCCVCVVCVLCVCCVCVCVVCVMLSNSNCLYFHSLTPGSQLKFSLL